MTYTYVRADGSQGEVEEGSAIWHLHVSERLLAEADRDVDNPLKNVRPTIERARLHMDLYNAMRLR